MKRAAKVSKDGKPLTTRARWARRVGWTLLVVAVLLVILDFTASPLVRSITNRKLAGLEKYTGHVDRVKVSIWRVHCEVDGMVFQRRGDDGPPLAQFKKGLFKLSFLSLLTGKLRASVVVDDLQVICVKSIVTPKVKSPKNIVRVPEPATEFSDDIFHRSFPIELTTIELKDSSVCYLDRSRTPAAEIMIEQLHVVATGLLSKPTADSEMPATITATAMTPGHGHLNLRIQANPTADSPRFYVQLALSDLSLPEINPLLLNYGKIEVAKGTLGFETEITAARGTYTGYVKPTLKDLDYKIANVDHTNSIQVLSRRVFAAVRSIFYHKDEVDVAAKAPFSGTIEPTNAELWMTIASVVRKALSQGLRDSFRVETPSNA
ncbi:MAG: hypothetical protein JWM35_1615 [Verrucomicrobia bacterium]|nr:hypothetical protein [Verrucomicrobiota bacterium]